jgi:hypothetical protein
MSWLEEALKAVFGAKLPDGSAGIAGSVSVPLGSGYSVEAERAAAVALLRTACDAARLNPAWTPGAGVTHCNGNAHQVAQAYGYHKLDDANGVPLMADMQIAILSADSDWEMTLDAARFGAHALKGGLGFATVVEHPHGHICPGYPEPAQKSESWGGLEPMVSNVGKTVGVMRLSGAFMLHQRPLLRFFLFKAGSLA